MLHIPFDYFTTFSDTWVFCRQMRMIQLYLLCIFIPKFCGMQKHNMEKEVDIIYIILCGWRVRSCSISVLNIQILWLYFQQYENIVYNTRVLFMTGQTWLENAHPLKLLGFEYVVCKFYLYYTISETQMMILGVNKSDELSLKQIFLLLYRSIDFVRLIFHFSL